MRLVLEPDIFIHLLIFAVTRSSGQLVRVKAEFENEQGETHEKTVHRISDSCRLRVSNGEQSETVQGIRQAKRGLWSGFGAEE